MSPRLVPFLVKLARFLRSRTGAALLVLLVCSALVFVVIQSREPEPSYQNIPAHEWFELVSTNSQKLPEVTAAFREMGAKGALFLGNELLRKPTRFDDWLLAHHQSIPGSLKTLLLKPQSQSKSDLIFTLLNGLRTNAAPAVPMVITWLENQGGALMSVTAPLTTNGFKIYTNSNLGFFNLPVRIAFGTTTAAPSLIVPPKSTVTFLTQAVVSAPGLVTTNVTVNVQASGPMMPPGAFQMLVLNGTEDPRVIPLLLNPIQFSSYRPPEFGPNLKTAAGKSVPLLLKNLNSSDRYRKLAALSLLGLTLPESQPAREAMITCLSQNDFETIESAVRFLKTSTNDLDRIVTASVDALGRFRKMTGRSYGYRTDQSQIYAALKEFSRHSPLVIPQLQTALATLPYLEQQNVLKLLGEIGKRDTVNLSTIESFTIHKEATVRAEAWFTLHKLTGDIEAEVKGHLALMENGTDQTVWKCYLRLGELGAEAQNAVPMLLRFLKHQDERMIAKAAETLGKIGPAAKEALPDLEALRTHPHLMVREPVEEAIRQITGGPKTKGAE